MRTKAVWRVSAVVVPSLALLFGISGEAKAEIGNPVPGGGYYLSVEGGWRFVDGPGVAGFSPGRVVIIS
jgi:hypothetical protein